MAGSKIMREIMEEIVPHLLPTIDHGAMGNVHHYNRVWEKIEAWHNRHSSSPAPDALRDAAIKARDAIRRFNNTRQDVDFHAYLKALHDALSAADAIDAALRSGDGCDRALSDVLAERQRQDAKWGEQNHDPFTYLTILVEEVGEFAQAALHTRFGGDAAANLRDEAVHMAAVALAIVQCLDRDKWREPLPPAPEDR